MVTWTLKSPPTPYFKHPIFLICLQKSGLNSCFMTMFRTSVWVLGPPRASKKGGLESLSLTISSIMTSPWSNAVANTQPGHSSFYSHCLSGFPFLQESFPPFPLKVLQFQFQRAVCNQHPSQFRWLILFHSPLTILTSYVMCNRGSYTALTGLVLLLFLVLEWHNNSRWDWPESFSAVIKIHGYRGSSTVNSLLLL